MIYICTPALSRFDVETGVRTELGDQRADYSELAFVPDSGRLFAVTGHSVFELDPSNGRSLRIIQLIPISPFELTTVEWIPPLGRLLVGGIYCGLKHCINALYSVEPDAGTWQVIGSWVPCNELWFDRSDGSLYHLWGTHIRPMDYVTGDLGLPIVEIGPLTGLAETPTLPVATGPATWARTKVGFR